MTPTLALCSRLRQRLLSLTGLVALTLPLALLGADGTKKQFDLPADRAETALKRFVAQSGVEVLLTTETVASVRTAAVKGQFAPADAMRRLLAGTALVAKLDGGTGTFLVVRAQPAERPKAQA